MKLRKCQQLPLLQTLWVTVWQHQLNVWNVDGGILSAAWWTRQTDQDKQGWMQAERLGGGKVNWVQSQRGSWQTGLFSSCAAALMTGGKLIEQDKQGRAGVFQWTLTVLPAGWPLFLRYTGRKMHTLEMEGCYSELCAEQIENIENRKQKSKKGRVQNVLIYANSSASH